jgi:DNA-binding beta-propeller fold protein YncE
VTGPSPVRGPSRWAVAVAAVLAAFLLLAGVVFGPALLRSDSVRYGPRAEIGAGALEGPIGVAYRNGRLYVSDAPQNRIVVFDTTGLLLDEWDGGAEGLARPMQLHLGKDGELYVGEYLADRVAVLATEGPSAGTVLRRLGGWTGSGRGALDAPGGASPYGDRAFVADFYNHRVQGFGPDSVRVLGRPGRIRGGRMRYPTDVAVSDSLLYVADAYNHRIQVFRPDGRYVRRWGGPLGTGLPGGFRGWFRVASGVHLSGDTVYVADFYNHRVQLFDGTGAYLGQAVGSLNLPTASAPGDRGELYVVDHGNARIVRFDREGGG